jgi:hypothetical protein
VYLTLNPVQPALLARRANRLALVDRRDSTTGDADILRRSALLIDCDSVRPSGISATDAEVASALAVRDAIQAFLTDQGWPLPVAIGMSGNGGHLLYRLAEANDSATAALLRHLLRALAALFTTAAVKVDESVSNAARITKLFGTIAAKGDPTADRPWRLARAEYHLDAAPVPRTALEALAAQVPEPPLRRKSGEPPLHTGGTRDWNVASALDGIGIGYSVKDAPYGTVYVLHACLTSDAHTDGAAITELRGGGLAYRCHHESCAGRTWADVRAVLGLNGRRGSLTSAPGVPWPDDGMVEPADESTQPSGRDRPLNGLIVLADVAPEQVRWLWRGRVPLGKLTILDGDPGLGKSLVTLDLAARTSTGARMPDGTTNDLDGPAGVVLLSAEDGLADTIRPRLDAAGADVQRIAALTLVVDVTIRQEGDDEVEVRTARLPTLADLAELEAAIGRMAAKLVVVDPLMAYLPGTTNAHRDQDVRQVLALLAALADRTGVSVVVVRHLNKAPGGNPLYRGGGSIGIIGASRSGLVIAPDPSDGSGARRILAPTKANLSENAPALAYQVEPTDAGEVRVAWEGPTEHTAASLLAAAAPSAERSAVDDAATILEAILEDGPRPVKEVYIEAAEAGIKERTLDRAKQRLNVKAAKDGFHGGWYWSLPPKSAKSAEECQAQNPGILGPAWRPSEQAPALDSAPDIEIQPIIPRDPGGWCDVHQRILSYREQMAAACSWCRPELFEPAASAAAPSIAWTNGTS